MAKKKNFVLEKNFILTIPPKLAKIIGVSKHFSKIDFLPLSDVANFVYNFYLGLW